MDTVEFEKIYSEFVALAKDSTFSEPADGEWEAGRIVAHVIANTRTFCATLAELHASSPEARYDSRPSSRPSCLDAIVVAAGSFDRLVSTLEQTSVEFLHLLAGLPEETGERVIPVLIEDDGLVRVDESMAFSALCTGQVRGHLPSHLKQLRGRTR